MRKLFLVIAGILCAGGFFAFAYIDYGGKDISDGLVQPEKINIEAKKEGLVPGGYISAYVDDVIDGDTFEATYKNKSYKVRLLCIDTPESVKAGVDVQPYGIEASKMTKRLVLQKDVKLVFEKGLRDKYGRWLAYVILESGENVNALLVRNGFARVEVISPNVKNRGYFEELQREAIQEGLGLWGLEKDRQPFVKDEDGEYVPRYWNLN